MSARLRRKTRDMHRDWKTNGLIGLIRILRSLNVQSSHFKNIKMNSHIAWQYVNSKLRRPQC